MTTFIQLTRVYKLKGTPNGASGKPVSLKTQPIIAAVSSVRPSNRLGHPEHRATVTLISGQEIDVAEKYSEVAKLLGITVKKKAAR